MRFFTLEKRNIDSLTPGWRLKIYSRECGTSGIFFVPPIYIGSRKNRPDPPRATANNWAYKNLSLL